MTTLTTRPDFCVLLVTGLMGFHFTVITYKNTNVAKLKTDKKTTKSSNSCTYIDQTHIPTFLFVKFQS